MKISSKYCKNGLLGRFARTAYVFSAFLLSFSFLQAAENPETVTVGLEFFQSIKMIGFLLFVILALVGLIAVVTMVKDPRMINPFYSSPTSSGRDAKAGWREFSLIIGTGVILMVGVMVLNINPIPVVSANTEGAQAAEVEDWTPLTDDKIVLLTEATDIQKGKEKYGNLCVTCHGANLEGTVGPNLTDKFWINGGSEKDIYKVITDGVPSKGMVSWKEMLTPKQRLQIIGYIRSMEGSNPAGAKAAEGTEYSPE